ncbi:ubiquitin carboxyl-terminal hydrolase 16/45 [Rhodotorula toruloides]|uniref:ubiquitinyl hydrolase 1 n=1 Tax=Rhodotorula toruloides TaxID=5286 RepID=A0A511KPW4_RHOTO|nr:ubiquitin carboxyl-terminal hydrolase 16/45 [Rhodotorula toruloides]
MRRRSSIALPSFGVRRGSNASTSSSVKDEIVRDIFHVGLVNLGNSCFYNTIVQSLSATQPLSDIINAAPDSSPALQVLSPSSPTYNPDLDALPSPLPMTAALLVLLDKLDPTGKDEDAKPKGKKAFNPKSLLRQLSLKHEEYAEATQQDSHELLRHLIDGVMMEEQDLIKKILEATPDTLPHRPSMHERLETVRSSDASTPVPDQASVSESEDESDDESDASSASSSSSSSSDAESEIEEMRLTERQRKKRKLRPFVGSIFEGKLASFIICDECKNVSLTKEDFMDISLSLKDETTNRMRKRDRIRRTLQAGFFSRKSGRSTASSGDDSSSKEPPQIKSAPNGVRRERISLSENEGSASASEADETDDDRIRPRMDRTAGGGARSRRNSLDPSRLSRETARETSLQVPSERSGETRNSSRDASPFGRALSVLSNGSGDRDASSSHHRGHHGHHHHHFHFHRRPKIPKPTPEQVAYIKKVLVDIPGPSATQGLPPGLRVARPPGSAAPPAIPAPTGTPAHSQDSITSITPSLSKLRIAAPAVDWQNTDLFECFRQFTSVEVLEGENSFACRNCWKWLNPDLEAKRKEDRARKKREREERRKARKAAKKGFAVGGDGHSVRQNGHGAGHEEDSDDERDPADVTARNTPAHSPKAVPAFAPLEEVPPIHPIEAAVPAPSASASNGTAIPPVSPTTTAKSGAPMRSFSISSAATSNAVSVSTDYEGGVSSEAIDTTTDEEDNTSPGLDDAASLSGSLGALPDANAKKLPLTVENVQAVATASTAAPTGSLAVPQDGRRGGPAASPAPSSAASLAPPPLGAAAGASSSVQPLHGHSRPTKPPPKKQRQILRRAHKRYLISPTDLPPVLVIHLKRFMQTSKSSLFGSAFVNLKKRDDPVSFPKEMDLTPFLAPAGKPPRVSPNAFGSAAAEEERTSRKSSRNGGVDRPDSSGTEVSEAIEVEKEVHNARYRLYAVIVHHGTIDTGHYASYVLSNRHGKASERKWLFCSDEEVLAATEAEVLRSKAYMLFYERVNPEEPSNGSSSQPPPAPSSTANTVGFAGDDSHSDTAPQPAALPNLTEEPAPPSHPTTTAPSPPPAAATA